MILKSNTLKNYPGLRCDKVSKLRNGNVVISKTGVQYQNVDDWITGIRKDLTRGEFQLELVEYGKMWRYAGRNRFMAEFRSTL